MQCNHFGSCGSCSMYVLDYGAQLQYKKKEVLTLLAPFGVADLEVFESPQSHYRARAEFRIWHDDAGAHYAMGGMDKKSTVIIESCPKVIETIAKSMPLLLEAINLSPQLKQRLFSVEFLATTAGEALITLIYHKKLDESWLQEAQLLGEKIKAYIMGRSRNQKKVLTREDVTEELAVDSRLYRYRHYESGFTQPNPFENIKMIEWVIIQAKKIGSGDLLESYCGLGNFTIPLSRYFDKVLATEISKRSIQAALENCQLNGVENIAFVRLSSEEMTQALRGVRDFNRLKGIDLQNYDFSAVLVDPPRAGLDETTIELISKIEHILYISCNPHTLASDLEALTETHAVMESAIFDQFPHTPHIESGVFLRKKK